MTDLAVIVPVLGRPHRAQPLADSLAAATSVDYRLVFVCSPGDDEQHQACVATDADVITVPWEPGRADWARKLQLAYRSIGDEFLLLGADDVTFEPGWDLEALAMFDRYDVGVVGTNDLANPSVKRGQHSCHPIVCRGYVEAHGTIDGPGEIVTDAYHHQWVDSELVATAQARGCWAFAERSIVAHHHPLYDRTVPMDDTYRRGSNISRAEAVAERQLFQERMGRLRSEVSVLRDVALEV